MNDTVLPFSSMSSPCITGKDELPVSNFAIIGPHGFIETVSKNPQSLGTVCLFFLSKKCCSIIFEMFLPVASSIPSVPGE